MRYFLLLTIIFNGKAFADMSCNDLSQYLGLYHIDKSLSDECALDQPYRYSDAFEHLKKSNQD